MQVAELIVTDPEAARALRAVGFLGQFLSPASPSEVARKLHMPANLAHHHARKYVRLGLLFETGRHAGRVQYQLTARTFKVPRDALHHDQDEALLRQLTGQFLNAHVCSSQRAQPSDLAWAECHFRDGTSPTPPTLPSTGDWTQEARPAYLISRTLSLSPGRYRRLLSRLQAVITQEAHEASPTAAPCTLTLFAFDGTLQEGATDSTHLSSFLDLSAQVPGEEG